MLGVRGRTLTKGLALDPSPQPQTNGSPTGPTALRILLLADDHALRSYGPVLRRLVVGLIDEVAEISMLCLGSSKLLNHVPAPPVRLITEDKRYQQQISISTNGTADRISITAPTWPFLEKLWPYRRFRRIAEGLAPFKPTVLHALSERQAHLARGLSQQLQIPWVLSLLSLDRPQRNITENGCSAMLCCDSSVARWLRTQRPDFARRVHLLPIGTHVAEKTCCFTLERSQPIIFCCCSFEHHHGLVELINAMKRLVNLGHKPLLTLSGQGPAERELRNQVTRLGLIPYVNLTPPIEMMLPGSDACKTVLRETDIFIQPEPKHTFQPELLEAMSVGNAVVAVGADNDLILADKTALVVPGHDDLALANAIDRLIRDHQLAQTLARNAQQYLRRHFLASHMVAHLGRAYHQAVKTKP